MSEENVDLALRAIEEFNTTRRLGPAFDRLVDSGFDFEDEIGEYDSRQEVRDFLEGFAESIGGLHVKVGDTMEADDTIVSCRLFSQDEAPPARFQSQAFTWVMRFDGGSCVWWRIRADRTTALEEAGLSE